MKKLMMLLLVSIILTAFSQVKAAGIEDDYPRKVKHAMKVKATSLTHEQRKQRFKFIAPIKYLGVHFRNTV